LGHLAWDDICQITDFNLDINYNSKFIDSDLSKKGVIQVCIYENKVLQLEGRTASRKNVGRLNIVFPITKGLEDMQTRIRPSEDKKSDCSVIDRSAEVHLRYQQRYRGKERGVF
jgi:hypothetical protein